MNDNVKKILEILGVEPNERFKIKDCYYEYYIDSELTANWFEYDGETELNSDLMLDIIKGKYKIIKLPKESKKKKLRDWTEEDYKKWKDKNCKIDSMCDKCIFKNVVCAEFYSESWVNNKDAYSDKFLNQEIDVEWWMIILNTIIKIILWKLDDKYI